MNPADVGPFVILCVSVAVCLLVCILSDPAILPTSQQVQPENSSTGGPITADP